MGRSRPTQRFVYRSKSGHLVFCEGGNEATAALLLEHLTRRGIVRRYKLQPFSLSEIDPSNKGIPDLIVELADRRIIVVEVKARRYLTSDVQDQCEVNKTLLASMGLQYKLWLDKDPLRMADKLNSIVWSNVRFLHRGNGQPFDEVKAGWITNQVQKGVCTLGDLMSSGELDWDSLMAAVARGIIHLNPNEVFDERATLYTTYPARWWQHLFGDGPVLATWWDSLPNS